MIVIVIHQENSFNNELYVLQHDFSIRHFTMFFLSAFVSLMTDKLGLKYSE